MSQYKVVEKVKKLNLDVAYTSPTLDSKRPDPLKKIVLHILKVFDLSDLFTKLFALPNFFNEVLGYIGSLESFGFMVGDLVPEDAPE
jgi:hypothetical protein